MQYGTRRARRRSTAAWALALALAAAPAAGDDAKARAAAAFDEAVGLFERAEYSDAARAFLRADDAIASEDALSNALSAARRANDHLTVAETATRVANRTVSEALAKRAREALREAERKLTRLELDCAPAPCGVVLDGAPVELGVHYALPGTHRVAAVARDGTESTQVVETIAGATHRIVVHATSAGEATRAAEVSVSPRADETEPAPQVADASSATRPPAKPPAGDDHGVTDERPLSPVVFYSGVAVTVVLAGVVTWSGLDAVSAKNDLPKAPTRSQTDDVESRVQRTDILFGVTAVVGAATAVAGFAFVEWGGADESAAVTPVPGGALISARGRFH